MPKTGSIEERDGGSHHWEIIRSAAEIFGEEEVLVDDRPKLSVGKKLRDGRRAGHPHIVVFGKRSIGPEPVIEIHHINQESVLELRPEDFIQRLKEIKATYGTF